MSWAQHFECSQELPADTAEAVVRIAKEQREEIDAEDRSGRLASGTEVSAKEMICWLLY